MSSENSGKKPERRKPKVSPSMLIRRRLDGPKPNPGLSGAGDGKRR